MRFPVSEALGYAGLGCEYGQLLIAELHARDLKQHLHYM